MKKLKSAILVLAMIVTCFTFNLQEVKAAELDQYYYYSKVFDYAYYYNANPDVVAARGNDSQSLMLHYMSNGIAEGRSASAFFNCTAYAQRYPELAAAFGNNYFAYVQYYVTTGAALGQNASADDNYLTPENQALVLNRLGTLVGSCVSVYDATVPRATNVQLAASHINGSIIQPGQTFSYSKTVGPRTTANGFVEAPVFIAGQHSTGIGGGICQVSSTLYTACRNANLTIVERHQHSLPVSYLPAGYDATVSGDYYDFKFKNNYNQPILLYASAQNGFLVIQLTLISQ